MPTLAPARPLVATVHAELDQAVKHGPLRAVVIPPCPALLVRMQAALDQPEPDLAEVSRIASCDVAMSAALLRCANSALYGSGMPVHTVGQAMNRLGLAHTAAEMTSYLVRRAIPVNSPHLRRFWERGSKRARAMGFLARRLPGVSPDVAHTCGLFSHVGMPVMLQSLKGYSGTLVEANARLDRPFIGTENANHRTDHAVVGALVARVWNLGPTVMSAIRRHHDLDTLGERGTDADVHNLVAALHVAEHLMRLNEGLEADADWTRFGTRSLEWLDATEDDLADWENDVRDLFDVE
ncbi:MAG: HDOD domain-containing protein [Vitreoscilla sp.]|nr:HDOD domain-containing protein [Vitreoscilla sp.]